MNAVLKRISLAVGLLMGAGAGQAQSRYQVGDLVENFTLTDRATGQPARLEDFKGSIVFLEWFAYWCPFCQAAAKEIGPGIVDYYSDRDGNLSGIPVKHVALNLEPTAASSTQTFINFYGLGTVLNDFDRAVANRFQAGGQPIFAIINLVENSPSHQFRELLYTAEGYGSLTFPIQTFRQAIDRVQAADVTPDPDPEPEPEPEPGNQPTMAPLIGRQPSAQTVRLGQRAAFVAGVTGDGGLLYQWSRDGVVLPTQVSSVLRIDAVTAADAGDYVVTVSNNLGTVTSAPARLAIAATAAGRLVNLSSNAFSGLGADQLVQSFVAEGAVRLLVRAVGPTLAGFGVAGVLTDPAIEVRDGATVLGSNGNWQAVDSGSELSATAMVVGLGGELWRADFIAEAFGRVAGAVFVGGPDRVRVAGLFRVDRIQLVDSAGGPGARIFNASIRGDHSPRCDGAIGQSPSESDVWILRLADRGEPNGGGGNAARVRWVGRGYHGLLF